jgi:parvulin-like peptidyl-prolyl isomerase
VADRASTAAPAEVSKLERENKELKNRVRALEETLETKIPLEPPPAGKMQLPSDQEVDQALDYLERVYKKIRDRVNDLDKPLPPPVDTPPPADGPPPPSKGSL